MTNTDGAPSQPGPAASTDAAIAAELRRRTRRGFVVSMIVASAGVAGWRWLKTRPDVDGIPGPLRRMLGFNQRLGEGLFDSARRIHEPPAALLSQPGPRVNGDIGLEAPLDPEAWRLRIVGHDPTFTLADLKTLPEVSQTTPLNCIEGWTTVARWTGVRLADFTGKYFPAGKSRRYVGLTTPTGDYFVGLDAPSAFHPQTLLCYAVNGAPLSSAHGAPLRLLIPVKYGIKNLKRVGTIIFTDQQPGDYWAKQGYDWFAGL